MHNPSGEAESAMSSVMLFLSSRTPIIETQATVAIFAIMLLGSRITAVSVTC